MPSYTRHNEAVTVAATDSLGTTQAVSISEYSSGSYQLIASNPITSVTWYGSNDGTNYERIYSGGSALTAQTPAADQIHEIPSACFGVRLLKAVVNSDGTMYFNLKG